MLGACDFPLRDALFGKWPSPLATRHLLPLPVPTPAQAAGSVQEALGEGTWKGIGAHIGRQHLQGCDPSFSVSSSRISEWGDQGVSVCQPFSPGVTLLLFPLGLWPLIHLKVTPRGDHGCLPAHRSVREEEYWVRSTSSGRVLVTALTPPSPHVPEGLEGYFAIQALDPCCVQVGASGYVFCGMNGDTLFSKGLRRGRGRWPWKDSARCLREGVHGSPRRHPG